jgi:hypothetical protein
MQHPWRRIAVALASSLQLCAALAGGARAPDGGRWSIPQALERHAAHSAFDLPGLSPTELATLDAGESVVVTRDEASGEISRMQVVGLQVVDAPRLLVWLSVLGGNTEPQQRLTRAMLARMPAGTYVRYQHIDLPWPIQDRHWVILCEKNVALAAASGGLIWEHHWSLHEDGKRILETAYRDGRIVGLTRPELDESIYLPDNHGAWTLFELGAERTLVVAHVNAELGGAYPNGLVRAFAKHQLREGFGELKDLSARVHHTYAEQPVIYDGFGMPISRQDALEAALRRTDLPALARAD